MSREQDDADDSSATDAAAIDPGDEFWELEPVASGETEVSEHVDDVLYDEA